MRRLLLTLPLLLMGGGAAAIAILLMVSPETVMMVPFLNTTSPDGYLSVSSDTVVFLKWTEDDQHHLQGQLMTLTITDDATKISQKTLAFTGIHNGSGIMLIFSVPGMPVHALGTLDGNTLTLSMQGKDGKRGTATFHATTIGQLNNAIITLQKHIKTAPSLKPSSSVVS
jgi:hypothetical protein